MQYRFISSRVVLAVKLLVSAGAGQSRKIAEDLRRRRIDTIGRNYINGEFCRVCTGRDAPDRTAPLKDRNRYRLAARTSSRKSLAAAAIT